MFLTREQVEYLTGTPWRELQCEHLRKEGIPFVRNRAGWPVVCRVHVEGGTAKEQTKQWEPRA